LGVSEIEKNSINWTPAIDEEFLIYGKATPSNLFGIGTYEFQYSDAPTIVNFTNNSSFSCTKHHPVFLIQKLRKERISNYEEGIKINNINCVLNNFSYDSSYIVIPNIDTRTPTLHHMTELVAYIAPDDNDFSFIYFKQWFNDATIIDGNFNQKVDFPICFNKIWKNSDLNTDNKVYSIHLQNTYYGNSINLIVFGINVGSGFNCYKRVS
jgi:hypothetical protein